MVSARGGFQRAVGGNAPAGGQRTDRERERAPAIAASLSRAQDWSASTRFATRAGPCAGQAISWACWIPASIQPEEPSTGFTRFHTSSKDFGGARRPRAARPEAHAHPVLAALGDDLRGLGVEPVDHGGVVRRALGEVARHFREHAGRHTRRRAPGGRRCRTAACSCGIAASPARRTPRRRSRAGSGPQETEASRWRWRSGCAAYHRLEGRAARHLGLHRGHVRRPSTASRAAAYGGQQWERTTTSTATTARGDRRGSSRTFREPEGEEGGEK